MVRGIKAQRGEIAKRTDAFPTDLRAKRIAAILDQIEVMSFAEFRDPDGIKRVAQ